jgi:hypothetical protein
MSETKGKDVLAAERLMAETHREAASSPTPMVANTAYLSATFAQYATQAIIDLLKQKNIISEDELKRALAHSYNTGADAKRQQAQQLIVAPAPAVRPN